MKEKCKYRWDNDFIIVMPVRNPKLLVLNYTSGIIFELCNGKNMIKQIFANLKKFFVNTNENIILDDCIRILRDLETKKVISLK